jgi:hypothetical protein
MAVLRRAPRRRRRLGDYVELTTTSSSAPAAPTASSSFASVVVVVALVLVVVGAAVAAAVVLLAGGDAAAEVVYCSDVSASMSTVTASALGGRADGVEFVSVVVRLYSEAGQPITNATGVFIGLASSHPCTIAREDDAPGTFIVRSSTAGDALLTATVTCADS